MYKIIYLVRTFEHCIDISNPSCIYLQVQQSDSKLTLVEFQKERSGSVDSYVQLRKLSIVTDDGYVPPDQKIAIKPSQLLKFAIQVVRGMVSCLTGTLH